jgi:hypothetical protein
LNVNNFSDSTNAFENSKRIEISESKNLKGFIYKVPQIVNSIKGNNPWDISSGNNVSQRIEIIDKNEIKRIEKLNDQPQKVIEKSKRTEKTVNIQKVQISNEKKFEEPKRVIKETENVQKVEKKVEKILKNKVEEPKKVEKKVQGSKRVENKVEEPKKIEKKVKEPKKVKEIKKPARKVPDSQGFKTEKVRIIHRKKHLHHHDEDMK